MQATVEFDMEELVSEVRDQLDTDKITERAAEEALENLDYGEVAYELKNHVDFCEEDRAEDIAEEKAAEAVEGLVSQDELEESIQDAMNDCDFVRVSVVEDMIEKALKSFSERLIGALGGLTVEEANRGVKTAVEAYRNEILEADTPAEVPAESTTTP